MADDLLTVEQFGATVKAKYPDYASVPDAELGARMLSKYPEYGDRVTPFTRRGGMADASMASPEVFKSTNEKDAAGNAVVRQPGWNEYEALPAWMRWIGEHGPAEVRKGLADMMGGEYAHGARRVLSGGGISAMAALSPLIAEAAATAPLATAASAIGGVGAGMIGQQVGEAGGKMAGLTDDQAGLLGDISGLVAGNYGTKLKPAQIAHIAEVIFHPGAAVGRAVGNAAATAAETFSARKAASAAPVAETAVPEDVAARIERIIAEGRAQGAANAPQLPPAAAPVPANPAPPPPAPVVPAAPPVAAAPAIPVEPWQPQPREDKSALFAAARAAFERGRAPVAPSPVEAPVAPATSAKAALSTGKAEAMVWEAAARANLERVSVADVKAAAADVKAGLSPADALAKRLGVAAPADPAAELARRLGTPSQAEAEAAIDKRWQRGELKTPSAPTARRMKAEAEARAR